MFNLIRIKTMDKTYPILIEVFWEKEVRQIFDTWVKLKDSKWINKLSKWPTTVWNLSIKTHILSFNYISRLNLKIQMIKSAIWIWAEVVMSKYLTRLRSNNLSIMRDSLCCTWQSSRINLNASMFSWLEQQMNWSNRKLLTG